MALNPDDSLSLPTDGGLAATHPETPAIAASVGPATQKQDNTFRARLMPFACWKVENIRFDYDSSFVKPEIAKELETLKQLRARHPGALLSIFGHTDPADPGQTPAQPRRYKLHIRSTDQVYPVRLAEVCWHDANRYKDLEQVDENHQFFKPTGQWHLKAGDEVYLPLDWEGAPWWDDLKTRFLVQPVEEVAPESAVRDEEYCKAISGRRAAAIYALLTRRTDIWEDIYSNRGECTAAVKGDTWGTPVLQTMLTTLGRNETTAAYEQSAGKRSGLFQAYMDNLCGSSAKRFKLIIQPHDSIFPVKLAGICTGDENRYKELEPHNQHLMRGPGQWRNPLVAGDEIVLPPTWTREQRQRARDEHFTIEPPEGDSNEATDGLELTKEDFLARGKDPKGKGDYQGCGAFNPLVVTSQGDTDQIAINVTAPNRRVLVLLYRSGSQVEPSHWPCPHVKDKTDGCRKRFWSNESERRSIRSSDRHGEDFTTRGTFACRHYDRTSNASPCETIARRAQGWWMISERVAPSESVADSFAGTGADIHPENSAVVPSVINAPESQAAF